MSKKLYKIFCTVFFTLCFVTVTAASAVAPKEIPQKGLMKPRTVKSAEFFSLEAATRCSVKLDEQNLITTVPFKSSAFRLESELTSDALPRYMVTGYSFDKITAERAVYNLVKGIDIKVAVSKGEYPTVSAEDLKGDLTSVVNKITSDAGLFYTYDAQKKYLKILRNNTWRLYVPASRSIMMTVLDALRGTGIHDVVPSWDDYSISFTGNTDVERKVRKLINFFNDGNTIVAFDVVLYRITSRNEPMNWQNLVSHFGTDSINTNMKGIVGRMIVSSLDEINNPSFISFINPYANISIVSEGVVMIPNGWSSRFDVGRCGSIYEPEAKLSLLVKASLRQDGNIQASLALDTSNGEITNFPSFTTEVGDTVLVFGIPGSILSPAIADSEIAVFMTPRLIRVIKASYSW